MKLRRRGRFLILVGLLLIVLAAFLQSSPYRSNLSTRDFWKIWRVGQKHTSSELFAALGEQPTISFMDGNRLVHEWEMCDGQIHIECDQNDEVTNAYAKESRSSYVLLDWLRRTLKVDF
jgi:hypothetical protein